MFATTRKLLEMIRFSHTLFALPFALLAAAMAWRTQRDLALGPQGEGRFARELLGIVLCMVFARSAAMAFNRLVDRHQDAANPRTAVRHLATGQLRVTQVAWFAVASSVAFVAGTLIFLPNRLPILLSLPVLMFLLAYSCTKRFTFLSHFWLGTALALSPLSAWIAIRGEAVLVTPSDLLPPLVLGMAVLSWVAGFDVIYACQDAQFDRQARLHSIPARVGVAVSLRVAAACHLVTLILLALLPLVFEQLGWLYGLGIVAVGLLLVYEHAVVRPNDLSRVNLAFFRVNAVISVGLFAVGTLDVWW